MMRGSLVVVVVLCVGVAHAALPKTMRAVVATGRGSETDFSKIKVVSDHPVPQPGRGQVLIRVAASSINPVDWKLYSSMAMSVLTLFGPKVLGFDVAGVVEVVGEGCSRLKPGDAVWADLGKAGLRGLQLGAWAEYAVADESQVGLKPTGMSFTDAASIPLAGLTDLQALREAGVGRAGPRRDASAVVTSGAGGTGTLALQMLKQYGASRIVTASSPAHVELLRSLGATDVVDYHKSTIWETLPKDSVDVVYDNLNAAGTADSAMGSLRAGGVFVLLPGGAGGLSWHPKAGVKQINYGLCDSSKHEDLDELSSLVGGGLRAVVGQSFPLEDIQKALEASVHGHSTGKIVLNITALLSSPERITLV